MKAIITVGCSASGKSTFSKALPSWEWQLIERDDIRRAILTHKEQYRPGNLWAVWKFNKENEGLVTKIFDEMVDNAAQEKKNIVISDTNLNSGRRDALATRLKNLGYEVEFKYYPIDSVDSLIKRDRLRMEPVGETVIKRQWQQWLSHGTAITGIKEYIADPAKPNCIVVDIDGTVADMRNKRGPFDWDKVSADLPRLKIIEIVRRFSVDHSVIFLSGRDSVCRDETVKWLDEHYGGHYDLFMRKERDFRQDRVIKDELFWENVEPYYNVAFAIDDRKQMIHYWNDIGVTCINVGNPYDDF